MAGKDKILRWTRIYVGPYNVSGDARTLSGAMFNKESIDMLGWSDQVMKVVAGRTETGISGFQAFANDAAAGAFSLLKDSGDLSPVGILFGGLAEPANGDPAYLMSSQIQVGSLLTFENGAAVINADFMHYPEDNDLTDNPFGFVVHGETSIAVTTNTPSIDMGALGFPKSKGAHAILLVVASDGGTWNFKIQDSPDDSAWADLITFTADGSIVEAEYATASGSVDRYIKGVFTRTSGTVTPVVLFAYN